MYQNNCPFFLEISKHTLYSKSINMATINFFGEMKLLRTISFRLPDPEYKSLIAEKGDGNLSDLLRDIISQYKSKSNVQQELQIQVNSKTKK